MKRCLKIMLSLTMALALAGSLSNAALAHSGHHTRRAKSTHMSSYTAGRSQAPDTADNTDAAGAAPAAPEAISAQSPDTAPAFAACYENGYCTGNNLCDVNGVCQNGGICSGSPCTNAPCYQNGTCIQNGSCDINGVCQNGGNFYGTVNQSNSSGNYGHHGGGHHGGRHHR